jgi:hypothetical protein
MLLQQGDVLLKKIERMPEGAPVQKKPRGYVLADGEVTVHAHVIEEEVDLIEKDGVLYLGVKGDAVTLKHEEHGHIQVPRGNYEVGIVKEYDHFAEEARSVAD